MRSIRRSLIVYFLVLLTGALAAVSWFSYRTTEESLREQQLNSRKLIEAQCEKRCQTVRANLDQRLLRQAQALANLARSLSMHPEGVSYSLGTVGSAMMPMGYLNMQLWLAQGNKYDVAMEINRAQPRLANIESAEDVIPDIEQGNATEYFQTYRANGMPMQRSESMDGHWFTLQDKVLKEATPLTEHFDEVELAPGQRVRRVTLKTPVWRFGAFVWIRPPWRIFPDPPLPKGFTPKGPSFAKGPTKGQGSKNTSPKTPKSGGPSQPRTGQFQSMTVFIQYASDLGPAEAKIREFERERDEQLARLEASIERDLNSLRFRMVWISCFTLLGICVGGYGLIRLGLSPLSKMSEAVSQVSPKNFRLPIRKEKLPEELRPIADRLVEVLDQLQRAFAREKQAAADISHELRTPLAALMTTLEVGLRKTRTVAEYQEILDECRSSGQHMYTLVERLLALARLDAGADQLRPSVVDAVDVALQCTDLIRPLAKARGLHLNLDVGDPIMLNTDTNKLREVLINLLHNAVEYNKPNGSITLSLQKGTGCVRIEVSDTGIGITPEAMTHIFERFYRADPSRHADTPHAGLGLAIVKSYIDLLGGTIRVASRPAGTTFTIELPMLEVPAAPETGITCVPAAVGRLS